LAAGRKEESAHATAGKSDRKNQADDSFFQTIAQTFAADYFSGKFG
jgi:hypothetical protein